ncbi:hypothetical protein [Dyadobacter sp. CY347]|uniref:hypothetical protein n=1 Tax=Dyadobacter sp. CY347 TaxID=2909336 RepID=UPI001F23DBAD|nr:hypothetical protein [Dyadobacter sp. CY347]MCF2489051.1 hypothetical protein [Dyadobacter sp. CY347]
MKKVRFFESIFIEALDRRMNLLLESHKRTLKQTSYELHKEQSKLDKKINEEIDILINPDNSALIEYKLKHVYAIENEIAKRRGFAIWKELLASEIAIFEETLIETRNVLVNEVSLLDEKVLAIAEPSRLHNKIINDAAIYSKTLNAAWSQIRKAIRIKSNLNISINDITEESRADFLTIKSVETVKLRDGTEMMVLINNGYLMEVTDTLESYFIELNDKINEAIKKRSMTN